MASETRWSVSLASGSACRSLTTPHPSLVSHTSQGSQDSPPPHLLTFRLEYSSSTASSWCRRVLLTSSILQQPSLLVTRWDVLPGDTQHNCFLVLDLATSLFSHRSGVQIGRAHV